MKTCNFLNAPLTRWILVIQDYRIEIEDLPAKDNVMADVLSRLHDGETYKKSWRDSGSHALKYEWNPEIEEKLRNLQRLQKEAKDGKNTRYKLLGAHYITPVDHIIANMCHKTYGHPRAEKTSNFAESF